MTGRDLVSASMRLLGVLASGETATAQEATDGLSALNRMIDSWSVEGLMIHAVTAESPLTLTPGVGSVTLGPLGDITDRPVAIERAVIRDGSVDSPPMRAFTLDEYVAIPDKSVQSDQPYAFFDDGGSPQRTLSLYPVPASAKQLVIFTKRALKNLDLDTVIDFPPGYERALVFNGALEMAPEFSRAVPEAVAINAVESKANVKRANKRKAYLRVTDLPVTSGYRRSDIFSGALR